MRFKTLAALWMKSIEGHVRNTTVKSYRFAIGNALRYLGEKKLGAITAKNLDELEQGLREEKKSYRSVRLIFNAVRLALGYAKERGEISSNPAWHYAIRKENYEPDREKKPAAHADIEELLEAYPSGHPYRIPILLMCGAGLRRGEARGLTWDHVDLEKGKLHVIRQLLYRGKEDYEFSPLRSKSLIRDVVLSKQLREELTKWKGYQKANGVFQEEKDAFVCSYDDGKPSCDNRFMEELRKKGFRTGSLQQAYEAQVDTMVDSLISKLSLSEIGFLRDRLLESARRQQAYG